MDCGLKKQADLDLHYFRVATVREKVLENEKFSRSGKSQGITFSVREIFKKKMKKNHGKVREFKKFPKKMLVNRLLEILVPIICKQYQKRNVSEHKLQAIYILKHSFSNIYGLRFFFKD